MTRMIFLDVSMCRHPDVGRLGMTCAATEAAEAIRTPASGPERSGESRPPATLPPLPFVPLQEEKPEPGKAADTCCPELQPRRLSVREEDIGA